MPGSFVDTNVLLYMVSNDELKVDKAEQIIAAGGAISVQVLNELTNVGQRKVQMSRAEIHMFLDAVRGLLTAHPLTVQTHETGLAIAERYQFSIYDSMIAAAAIHAGCDQLWSEDMHDGLRIDDRLELINPFRTAG